MANTASTKTRVHICAKLIVSDVEALRRHIEDLPTGVIFGEAPGHLAAEALAIAPEPAPDSYGVKVAAAWAEKTADLPVGKTGWLLSVDATVSDEMALRWHVLDLPDGIVGRSVGALLVEALFLACAPEARSFGIEIETAWVETEQRLRP